MLQFKTITLDDKSWFDELVFANNSRSADFNFGNIYIWDKKYKQLICRDNNRIITKIRYDGYPAFAFPVGFGDLKSTILHLKEFADYKGYPLRLYGVEESAGVELEKLFPNQFDYKLMVGNSDYIYLAERLSTFSGKSLHGKKNHCNKFESEHPDWEFVPITRELIPKCMDMLSCWQETNKDRLDKSISDEHDAIVRAFAAYEKLGLEGGALISGGKIIGFSVGEMCNADCFDVHFEKADISINGAYTMVCREMVKMAKANHEQLIYINREDDMDLESLRISKLSYKPEYLLNKYVASWKN